MVVPALIFVLSLVWMQLVKGQGEEEGHAQAGGEEGQELEEPREG